MSDASITSGYLYKRKDAEIWYVRTDKPDYSGLPEEEYECNTSGQLGLSHYINANLHHNMLSS